MFSVAECKEKWKNLRTVFARRMKLPSSGSEKGLNRKRKAYYLADVMQFALPFIKTAATPSLENLPEVGLHEKHNAQATCQNASEAVRDDEDCDDREYDNRSGAKSLVTQPLPPLPPPPSPIPSVKPSTSTCTPAQFEDKESLKSEPSPQKHYKKKMTQKAEIEADKVVSAYTHFKGKKARLDISPNQTCSEDERKEALKMFLLSLMPELVHFSEAQLKLFKRRVFGLIDEIELMETSVTASARMTTFPQPSVTSMSSSSTSPSLVVAHKSPNADQHYEKFRHFLNPNEFTTNSM